jgi:osmoprotectant transport system substrate-binding protein
MVRRVAALIMAVLVGTAVTACGSGNPLAGGGAAGTVVVGSANFTESQLLMEIYAEALRKAGIRAQTRPGLGTREITNRALTDGSITVMPEYSGNLLHFLDPASTATTADDVYAGLRRAVPQGLEVLEQSSAEDSDVLVITPQTSTALGLTSMDQLGQHCRQLILGAAGEWPARWKDKIAQVYGCTFRQILSTDAGGPVTLEALRLTAANRWVELADPKHMYPAQRIVPLIRAGSLSQAGTDALNRVSAALTTAKLVELNRRIAQDRAVPAELGKDFVNGLR